MAFHTIICKDHASWLKAREGGIGSSEVATILGVNTYQTPYQLWLRKTGRAEQGEEKETFLMKAGHYLEDAISHFCADDAGLDIVKSSASEFIVVNNDKEFLRASPDRYAYPKGATHNRANKVIIECKSTQKQVDKEDVSPYWFCQVQYQLGIAELDRAYLAWLTQGRDFDYLPIDYDKEFFGFIIEQVERFWVDHILGDREPELTTIEDVRLKYPKQTAGKSIEADENLLNAWGELKDKSAEIKRLEGEKQELEDTIKAAMLDAESLVLPATLDHPERVLATWKSTKDSQRLDVAALKTAAPETYMHFLKQVPGTRQFRLK